MTQTTAGRITEIIREHLKFYAGSGEWAAAVEAGQEIAAEIDALTRERDEARAEVAKLKEQNRVLATTSLRDVIKSVHRSGRSRGQ